MKTKLIIAITFGVIFIFGINLILILSYFNGNSEIVTANKLSATDEIISKPQQKIETSPEKEIKSSSQEILDVQKDITTLDNDNDNCISLSIVQNSKDKCLVTFEDNVYDLTYAKKWSMNGHEGKHSCGQDYTADIINSGSHKKEAEDLMKKYFIGELC